MAAKRRRLDLGGVRLQDLLHTGSVSHVGLAQLLKKLHPDSDLATETIRKQLLSTNKELLRTHEWQVQLQLVGGAHWTWSMLDPVVTLATMLEKSKDLQALYTEAWRRSPCTPESPWRVVAAFDEFTPGNKLSLDQGRKTMVLSFSFLELGQAALSRGSSWATVGIVRSNIIKQAL